MQKLILVLLLSLLVSLSATGQTEKKILLYTSGVKPSVEFANRLDTIISMYYPGQIVRCDGILPDSLENFEAIFLSRWWPYNADRSTLRTQVDKITTYLENGGNVFFDMSFIEYVTDEFGNHGNISDSIPKFSELTGITNLSVASMVVMGVSEVSGVNGTFTEGYKKATGTSQVETAAPSLLSLIGKISPVLNMEASLDGPMAWAYTNDDHKTVVDWHITEAHTEHFIGLVLCNYFNLCTPLSSKLTNYISSLEISGPTFTSSRSELHFRYELPEMAKLSVSVYNILGEQVYYSYDNEVVSLSGEMSIPIQRRLLSGGYFLEVRTPNEVVRKPFVVVN